MQHYEMLVVLPGTIMENEAAPIMQTLQETLEKYGATEIVSHDMGKSRLAYPIKHIRYGYFYIVQCSAEPAKMKEVSDRARLINNILRLVVKVYDPRTQTVDATKLSLTPLANVVSTEEVAPTPRPENTHVRRETPILKPMVGEDVVKKTEPTVSMEEIEEKLDQILEKDLEKV